MRRTLAAVARYNAFRCEAVLAPKSGPTAHEPGAKPLSAPSMPGIPGPRFPPS
jgi:hypothetical protein